MSNIGQIGTISKVTIFTALMFFSLGLAAKTERVEIEAKHRGETVKVELVFNKKVSEDPEIFTIRNMRAKINGVSYPVLNTSQGASLDWCKFLGFKYLSYSSVGSSSFEFDNEEWGLSFERKSKTFVITEISTNTDNIVNFIQCTQNPHLSY